MRKMLSTRWLVMVMMDRRHKGQCQQLEQVISEFVQARRNSYLCQPLTKFQSCLYKAF